MNLIFDIGFNVGKFTKHCFSKYPFCKVVAVEANPNLYNEHINDFRFNNFVLLNNVVSNTDCQPTEFFISPKDPTVSTASKSFIENSRFKKGSKNIPINSVNWTDTVIVKSISLDTMVDTYGTPDLIKIDVEGYEAIVLKGLSKKLKTICFEWHEEDFDSIDSCVNHLISIGYDKFGVIGYFCESNLPSNLTFDERADPFLVEPNNFCAWSSLRDELKSVCNSNRRINYGMLFCK